MKPQTPPEQEAVACETLVVHATGDPYAPLELQVSTLDPEHVACPGAHVPEQTPLTHVWFTQAVPFCQAPVLSHVCGCVPEAHCSAPGVHDPEQTPPTHAWFVHDVAFCHVPLALHVCGCWPLHCFCVGAHTPEQTPATHVWFEHSEPLFVQAPALVHVCGC